MEAGIQYTPRWRHSRGSGNPVYPLLGVIPVEAGIQYTPCLASFPWKRESSIPPAWRHSRGSGNPVYPPLGVIPVEAGIQYTPCLASFPWKRESSIPPAWRHSRGSGNPVYPPLGVIPAEAGIQYTPRLASFPWKRESSIPPAWRHSRGSGNPVYPLGAWRHSRGSGNPVYPPLGVIPVEAGIQYTPPLGVIPAEAGIQYTPRLALFPWKRESSIPPLPRGVAGAGSRRSRHSWSSPAFACLAADRRGQAFGPRYLAASAGETGIPELRKSPCLAIEEGASLFFFSCSSSPIAAIFFQNMEFGDGKVTQTRLPGLSGCGRATRETALDQKRDRLKRSL